MRKETEQLRATSEILKAINSSSGENRQVFDLILQHAAQICEANLANLVLVDGMVARMAAMFGAPEAFADSMRERDIVPASGPAASVISTQRSIHILDIAADEKYISTRLVKLAGARTTLGVPMAKDGNVLGAILIYRQEVRPFSSEQEAVLENFADYAVLAIENVRLFNETQEALERQTATSEVLEIISSSPGELDPVFQKMLDSACRVCGASFGTMNLWNGEEFINAAQYNTPPAFAAFRQQRPIRPHPDTPMAKVVRTHRLAHEHDLRMNPAYLAGVPNVVAIVDVAGARTILNVPMLKDDTLIGTITIFRQEVRPFTDKQIALIENFTKQAVIAIENARLLRELRLRTDDLSRSLHDLRTAQDRLVQTEKLASLGQLTAGIAHEIKNPLNFVNNFSALSAELVDEMTDVLENQTLDAEAKRRELDEIRDLLKSNLGKVVQHGKRADSIVKNMLLHSREGSGERRLAEINRLVEESLNLAYHGARAEKAGFTITLKHDLDPEAGALDIYPQEMTRALLNLISNGFYAATNRNAEAGDETFEPILSAATRNLGGAIEIRIRDNGTGIPPEVREDVQPLFYHQTDRRRNGTWPLHDSRHHR